MSANKVKKFVIGQTEIEVRDPGSVRFDEQQTLTSEQKLQARLNIAVPSNLSELIPDSTHRTVSDTEKNTWNSKYAKPSGGISKSDLASSVQTSLNKADSSISDAPSDGKEYVRKNGEWIEVQGGGGSAGIPVASSIPSGGMLPNVYYSLGTLATDLNVTLAAEVSGILNEYMLQFSLGLTAYQITLPASVKWQSQPVFAAGKTYQVSIVNNYGICAEFTD